MAADRGLLRNRAFLAIWSAQILSQVAANAVTSALIVRVAELTRSNTSSSVLILLAIVPAVLFGIVAGVVVDRSNKRRVLVVTNALRALAVVAFLALGEGAVASYIVNFLVAAVTVFFVPAESSMIPTIVRKQDLLVANSLFTFTFNFAFLVGFIILAPVVIAVYSFETLFIVVAAMFGAASLLCVTLPDAVPAEHGFGVDIAGLAVAQTRSGITEAFRYLRTAPSVTWSLVYIALTYTLVAVAGALAPGFMREVLHLGERNVVVLVAPAGVGVVAGLIALNLVGRRLRRARAIGLGLVVALAALLVLAAARLFTAVVQSGTSPQAALEFGLFVSLVSVTAFVFGVAYAFITVPSMTLLQEELREDIRGRIFGVLNMLVSVFGFLPLIVVGPVADVWGVAPVFVAAAVLVLLVWIGGRGTRVSDGAPIG